MKNSGNDVIKVRKVESYRENKKLNMKKARRSKNR
jgi:hypothetical protein